MPVESGVQRVHVDQRPPEQPGADQQHQRDGNLRHDQALAQAPPACANLGQRGLKAGSRRLDRRSQAEQQTGQQRNQRRKCQYPQIRPDLQVHAPAAIRHHRDQPVAQPVCQQDAQQAAQCREQQPLREQLPDHPPAPRSDRQADRNFALPRRRFRQQQVRDIGTRDQQHQRHHAHQDAQRLRETPPQFVEPVTRRLQFHSLRQSRRLQSRLVGARRIVGSDPREYRLHFRPCLCQALTVAKPAHHRQPVEVGALQPRSSSVAPRRPWRSAP